ncbi:2-amino-4-hydroxy-6-hydroxymethyldihydropteridine diphosphokinase [Longitalea arenae]|uniref:2-amino-4-hydroxy-6- hydroxymethyldihydropteridine diphosphokinase n=1 Tax=Longitalea arenae TaxID=2812558 RepID=UPI0019681FDC|nr:2-amino-4-hydroxy-6-hydroxymethyldihydropteridine diphosphokinase [Longitalea arenae]
MNKVFLLIGGNMGDRLQNLHQAVSLLSATCGPVVQQSAVYETAAWGKTDQAAFLNQALLLTTSLSARELITTILSVEEKMGRRRLERFGPRLIDIDILFYNDAVIDEPDLSIPHPELPNRRFVLAPLNEIAPAFVHPVLKKSVAHLLEECPDKLEVAVFKNGGK